MRSQCLSAQKQLLCHADGQLPCWVFRAYIIFICKDSPLLVTFNDSLAPGCGRVRVPAAIMSLVGMHRGSVVKRFLVAGRPRPRRVLGIGVKMGVLQEAGSEFWM